LDRIARREAKDPPPEGIESDLSLVGVCLDADPGTQRRRMTPAELDQITCGQPESRGHGGRHSKDAVPAEPALTPALSLSEGEGVGSIPSPPLGERVAFRAEPLASSGEARAEMVRGRSERAKDLHEGSRLGATRVARAGAAIEGPGDRAADGAECL